MLKEFLKSFRPAALLLLWLTVLTGGLYPAVVTLLAQTLFPAEAGGSLVIRQGKVLGSALIGQHFEDPGRFWGRPSATAPFPDNAAASSGSNLGPLNPALAEQVGGRLDFLRENDGLQYTVPLDLVTASASGLDPHVSPEAALYQAERVAKARRLPLAAVRDLVQRHVEDRQWGLLGQPRVNVLLLNLDLETLALDSSARSGQNPAQGE